MIRLACILFLLVPAMARAQGDSWEIMITVSDTDTRTLGAIGACLTATVAPQDVAPVLADAGWERADEYDGTSGFQSDNISMMFWNDPGFCMLETADYSTAEMSDLLESVDILPVGEDDAGCAQFTLYGTTATLTGGGNDPACTSETEAALRFEVTE